MTNPGLHDIGLKHGTDKATYHKYLDFYEKHLPRHKIRRFLEIGVLQGASLKTWREWLHPECHVEGWDISPPINIPGCTIKQVDQTQRTQLLNNAGAALWDVILDDGAHTAETIQTSFSTLFPSTVLYIIEDLHAPWVSDGYLTPEDTKTNELLENIWDWNSRHSTPAQSAYIRKEAEVVEVFTRMQGNTPLSMTAVIKNRSNWSRWWESNPLSPHYK